MNQNSPYQATAEDPTDTRPILIVPYMWIGDFVRGHTVVRVLKQRWPNRPVDLLVSTHCAPRWSITCPACGQGSSGTCHAAGWRWPGNGAWQHCSVPTDTVPR